MESVTVYFADGDLGQIWVAITTLAVMVFVMGLGVIAALGRVEAAIRGKGLRDLKEELERIKAENTYSREDMEAAFDAGIGHATDDEPAFDEWLEEAEES